MTCPKRRRYVWTSHHMTSTCQVTQKTSSTKRTSLARLTSTCQVAQKTSNTKRTSLARLNRLVSTYPGNESWRFVSRVQLQTRDNSHIRSKHACSHIPHARTLINVAWDARRLFTKGRHLSLFLTTKSTSKIYETKTLTIQKP